MVQNLISLFIVFSAVGYTIFSVVRNLTAKKESKCGGCDSCSFKQPSNVKHI